MDAGAHEFDVAVIGGGPAGSTAACRLARAGRRVVLFERDRFPRFHIGESLLASVNDVLDEIGATDLVRAQGFPVKWGATFGTGDGTFERFADFAVSPEVRTPQTWQVPRAEFDELLLRHAAASGADVREGHRVVDVAFDADGATVAVRDEADSPSDVRVAAVVDASGRVGLLARKLGRSGGRATPRQHRGLLPLLGSARARRAGEPATSASWRARTWAGSGSSPSPTS